MGGGNERIYRTLQRDPALERSFLTLSQLLDHLSICSQHRLVLGCILHKTRRSTANASCFGIIPQEKLVFGVSRNTSWAIEAYLRAGGPCWCLEIPSEEATSWMVERGHSNSFPPAVERNKQKPRGHSNSFPRPAIKKKERPPPPPTKKAPGKEKTNNK